MANVHPGFAQSGKVLHDERVESVRPLRPAHNQQTSGPSGSRQPPGLIDPGAHGIARKHALGGIKTFGVRQRQTDAPRQLCQHAVAGPGYGVLLMQHGRQAKQARGKHGGKGRITAKTGHNIRVKAPDNAERLAYRPGHAKTGFHRAQAAPQKTAHRQPFKGDARRANQTRFRPVQGTHKKQPGLRMPPAHFFSHGQSRKDMTASAARGQEDVEVHVSAVREKFKSRPTQSMVAIRLLPP